MKSYEQLNIRDHFMFGKVCLDPNISQLILSALLDSDITLEHTDIEKYLKDYKSSKFIRLDLLAKDDENIVYNAELQHKSTNPDRQLELPKRSRYYQSILDNANLKNGTHYKFLPETYIIFICTYDPFGMGLPKYSFETKCCEIDIPAYNDYAHKIFFNTTAPLNNLPQNTRNMLEYFETGSISDTATKTIDNAVADARLKEKWREEYMLTYVHDIDVYQDGYEDGYDKARIVMQEKYNSIITEKDSALVEKDKQLASLQAEIDKLRKTQV